MQNKRRNFLYSRTSSPSDIVRQHDYAHYHRNAYFIFRFPSNATLQLLFGLDRLGTCGRVGASSDPEAADTLAGARHGLSQCAYKASAVVLTHNFVKNGLFFRSITYTSSLRQMSGFHKVMTSESIPRPVQRSVHTSTFTLLGPTLIHFTFDEAF